MRLFPSDSLACLQRHASCKGFTSFEGRDPLSRLLPRLSPSDGDLSITSHVTSLLYYPRRCILTSHECYNRLSSLLTEFASSFFFLLSSLLVSPASLAPVHSLSHDSGIKRYFYDCNFTHCIWMAAATAASSSRQEEVAVRQPPPHDDERMHETCNVSTGKRAVVARERENSRNSKERS